MPAGYMRRVRPVGRPRKARTSYGQPSTRHYKAVVRKNGGRRRKAQVPRGLRPLTIPMKIGYTYDKIGTGAVFLDFDDTIGLHLAPPAWFTRYQPIFEFVRINKVHIEITCPYNIGQHNVGTQSLYQMWYKKAQSTAETPPGSITEWLNMQSAKRSIFAGKRNSVNLYYTPAYETTVQPLNVAVTQLRLLYKQWQTIQTTAGAMTPHIGVIGQIHRLDGSVIGNTNVFKVNVTMYCELKGVKQL